ncbi:uncharacterized protein LOC136771655 isoform X2 [Amia ocellicauda]|uniref:uncharacterized protein LOC136771655 isoform X2 n=1 Tax=Amia ocellicauda TaxID=2972642 RepID=UPI003463C660
MYAVVEFTDTREVEVIPAAWLVDDSHCFWPPFRSAVRAVQTLMLPDSAWMLYAVRVLHKTDSYARAKSQLNHYSSSPDRAVTAENHTAKEKVRKRKRSEQTSTSASELEEEEHSSLWEYPDTPSPSQGKPVLGGPLPAVGQTVSPQQYSSALQAATPADGLLTAFERKVLWSLEEIRMQVAQNGRLLSELLARGGDGDELLLAENLGFPLGSMEAVDRLEDRLVDEAFGNALVFSLSAIGGADVKSAVGRMMGAVLQNCLASQFNWVGKGGQKRAFKDLRLRKIMFRAVRRNGPTRETSEDEFTSVAMNWLRYAKDRGGGRRRRAEAAAAKNQEESGTDYQPEHSS